MPVFPGFLFFLCSLTRCLAPPPVKLRPYGAIRICLLLLLLLLLLSSSINQANRNWNCSPWRMVKTPVNTQYRPLPLRNNCFNPTPSYCSLICYRYWTLFFSAYFTRLMWQCNCSNCRLWLYIFLFSPVTVSFYSSSIIELRFVNCCTNKWI